MRRLLKTECQGAAALEFALCAPLLFLLIFTTIDFGRLFWLKSCLQYAVEQAARCSAISGSGCGSSDDTAIYASAQVFGPAVSSSNFIITSPACGTQVNASVPFTFTPGVLLSLGSITVKAQSCHP